MCISTKSGDRKFQAVRSFISLYCPADVDSLAGAISNLYIEGSLKYGRCEENYIR